MNFTLLDGHICMTHINHCFQVLLIAFKSLSRMQPWRTEIFLQASHLPAHHSFVLPPELEQIQVIKGLIFCGNCPWLKIHSCRKTNCQCREKKLPFVRIEFIPAQISGEVQCWFWPWIFMFSKTPHDCKISSTISLRNQFPLLACSCLLNVPQVDPAAAIHGSSMSLFG